MHPALRSRAEKRFGLFTTAEAELAGYGHGEIRRPCRTGRSIRLRRGILVTAEDLAAGDERAHRFDMECLAVLMSLDRQTAAISHGSAAHLWDVPLPRGMDPTIRLTTRTGGGAGRTGA
ncbi:hypothetical protein [Blastococcus deserti]|uniref:AbiEi antitoxin N-terminal domain-containing protein n=1 Tax=Blastococcus deserti TaxID=2259033 RepID=A0ABW4XDW5_9ACTN